MSNEHVKDRQLGDVGSEATVWWKRQMCESESDEYEEDAQDEEDRENGEDDNGNGEGW